MAAGSTQTSTAPGRSRRALGAGCVCLSSAALLLLLACSPLRVAEAQLVGQDGKALPAAGEDAGDVSDLLELGPDSAHVSVDNKMQFSPKKKKDIVPSGDEIVAAAQGDEQDENEASVTIPQQGPVVNTQPVVSADHAHQGVQQKGVKQQEPVNAQERMKQKIEEKVAAPVKKDKPAVENKPVEPVESAASTPLVEEVEEEVEEETPEMKAELSKALGITIEELEKLTEEEKIYKIKRKIADRYIEKDPLGQDPIHIVYASSAAPPDLMLRSAWSIYATATDETKPRLHFHIFYEDTPDMEATFKPMMDLCTVTLYEDPLQLQVTPKVWGYSGREAFLKKLESPANYWRFYIPEFLWEKSQARRVLYLDGDTVCLSDIGAIWDKVFASTSLAVSSGTQNQKACNYGKQIKVTDERLRAQHLDPAEPCLQGGVLFIDVKKWVMMGMQTKAEQLLVTNAQKKLYSLGSMPPLLILLYDNYQKLPRKIIYDAKGKDCCSRYGEDSVGLVHPVKGIDNVADWQAEKGVFQPEWLNEIINPDIDHNTGQKISATETAKGTGAEEPTLD